MGYKFGCLGGVGRLQCRGYFTLKFWLLRLINYGVTAFKYFSLVFSIS